ncbi:MAG: Rrf2 family transcriptional regulator, cysteine metabolism repressor [Petroclostridium sp.]|jgi:Rrf2 family protein|uniref:RrF2 family transcriptional regulator n=1 Tax=Petroclostridium xylanilyticum TaxID=1792311 RepID=UPI000B98B2A0|nr:Rrf2 family transcriptional regulator [Petroclostridium xylanilyticum]MBZ4644764.1 rrf2 family protein putative transcriptional regulator [Clostridia bacterium]MDK2810839.1 Rrf2 family transcriptional regulator, cysteine metabolism repressor [Petroclostridium sp.]
MRLSTKGRYGVKAMLDLAIHSAEGHIALKNIAERQDISEHYLEQLIATLRKAGLVKSVRGAQGGYTLAQEPSQITVGAILRALEGSLAPVDCVIEDEPIECANSSKCVTQKIWAKVRDSINQVVDSITLQDLIDDYKSMNSNNGYMYYI